MRQWFYTQHGQQQGPLSEDDMVAMFRAGRLSADTLVWTEGLEEWTAARDIESLLPKAMFPPPIPVSQSNSTREIATGSTEQPAKHDIKKTPVVLSIIFTVITAGIYYPCWFLTRREALNSLKTTEKLGKGVFIFAVVVFSVSLLLSFVSGGLEGIGEELSDIEFIAMAKMVGAVGRLISAVASITLLVQCFKVRRMLREHFAQHLGQPVVFSGVALFFFQIYYLQYKINRL